MKLLHFACLAIFFLLNSPAWAQSKVIGPKTIGTEKSEQATFEIVEIATDLNTPWSIAFLPDGEALVTQRPGGVVRVNLQSGEKTQIDGAPKVFAKRQGGMLDIILSPDFANDNLVYFSYAAGTDASNHTEIARARLEGNALVDTEVIFKANTKEKKGGFHFGSRLVFDDAGYLFATIGEGSRYKDKAQDPKSHFGSVIRINADGSVPQSNPFADGVDGAPEVYSYGHRNPQGLTLHPTSGTVWEHEHGPKGGDEVNIIRAGKNYGWPKATFGINYNGTVLSEHSTLPGMVDSIVHWVPSIAPSGMAFYTATKFPKWRGDLFVGALAGAHLRRLEVRGNRVVAQEELLADIGERIRDVRLGPDGFLYVLTNGEDQLLQLRPIAKAAGETP